VDLVIDVAVIDTVTVMARIVRVREARNPPTGVVTHPLLPEMRIEIVVVMAVIEEEEVEGVMMTDGGTTVTTTGGEEMTAVTIGEAVAASTATSHHVTDTGTTGEEDTTDEMEVTATETEVVTDMETVTEATVEDGTVTGTEGALTDAGHQKRQKKGQDFNFPNVPRMRKLKLRMQRPLAAAVSLVVPNLLTPLKKSKRLSRGLPRGKRNASMIWMKRPRKTRGTPVLPSSVGRNLLTMPNLGPGNKKSRRD